MRYLLVLALVCTGCKKQATEEISEVEVVDVVEDVIEVTGAAEPNMKPVGPRRVLVSEGVPKVIERDGWKGPATSMSGAWDGELHNCILVQTALPASAYAQLTPEEQENLIHLHSELMTQWDRDKRLEAESCAVSFPELPVLAECDFEVSLTAVTPKKLDETSKAALDRQAGAGRMRFQYSYYNPSSAIDEPLFGQRCQALNGKWTAVDETSKEYEKAVDLYAKKVGRTNEDAPPMDEVFQGMTGQPPTQPQEMK